MLCFYALVVPHVAHLQPQLALLHGVDEHLNRRHHGAAAGVHHALLGHGERARACDGCRARCDGLIEHLYLAHSRPGSDRVVLRAVENNRRHDRRLHAVANGGASAPRSVQRDFAPQARISAVPEHDVDVVSSQTRKFQYIDLREAWIAPIWERWESAHDAIERLKKWLHDQPPK